MYILPSLDLKGGETVHAIVEPSQGEARPLFDPVEVVQRFSRLGAQGFHVVDVDHAEDPDRNNDEALVRLLEHTTLPVEAGGGVRSLKRIQQLLDTGVRRVLVGSMGVQHPSWLKEAAEIFADTVVPCVDVRKRRALIKGRSEEAKRGLMDHLTDVDALGFKNIHITDVDGNGSGIDFVCELSSKLSTRLSFRGSIANEDVLARLADAGIEGVVLGAEAYDGRLAFGTLAKTYRIR